MKKRGQLLPTPLQISSCTLLFFEKTILPPLKNNFWIILSKIFSEHLFKMNSSFINLEIKKIWVPEKMFQNDFFVFWIFYFKISFAYRTTISETSKTVNGDFGIFEECRV